MHLTPGEKAVLGQIRVLYAGAGERDQQLKALMMQWPPTQFETYKSAFSSLVAKQLISDLGTQLFRITDAGLKAIGVVAPKPQPQAVRPVAASPAPRPAVAEKPAKPGILSRLRFWA